VNDTAYARLRARAIDLLWQRVEPMAQEIEEAERIPYDRLWPALEEMGAFAFLIAERWGGHGLTATQYVPLIAEFAKIQGGIRALVHVHNSMAHAFQSMASEEQCAAVLPVAARGEASVAFALTEPAGGTGADLHCTARLEADSWVIDGEKWLITNSDFASHFIVFAKTSGGRGDDSVTAFVVERDRPGFRRERLAETMGCKGGEHGRLVFDSVRIPAGNVLGRTGQGLAQMESALEISRVFVAASSLGTSERALQLAVEHSKRRVTFGRPLADRQAIQRYLAEMAVDVYALRQMLADATARWDAGHRIPAEAAMCKLFGLEAVGRVTDRALLVFGGIGYTRGAPIERLYRDARLNWLEEGTPTIQQLVIARQLLTQAGEPAGRAT
jgi:alkylation response protein AidB-like acyl-CoA dehydrogenase